MKVFCAWCQKEGKPDAEALIGEKEPLEDPTASHGICPDHRRVVEAAFLEARTQSEVLREEVERHGAEAEKMRRKVDP